MSQDRSRSNSGSWREWFGLVALFGFAAFYLSISWRKWPDPMVDFGRELYIPWRITQGAVLYLDVNDIYGPLSHYFNALLFQCFGPGLMVLVAANLAVFSVILATIYNLCRRAWGMGATLAAGAVFVGVFAFSQFVGIGNYNYAAPYSHETTHGVMVCLLLVWVLARWVDNATSRDSLLAGFLFGLSVVLKPEIMLAAGAVTFVAGIVRLVHRGWPGMKLLGAWAAGAALPVFCFTVYFAVDMPWSAAFGAANRGWLNVGTTRTISQAQMAFLGLDHPWAHFVQNSEATLMACALFAAIAVAARLCEKTARLWLRLLLGGSLVGCLVWLSCSEIVWLKTGECLSGLMLIYTLVCVVSLLRPGSGELRPVRVIRLLLAVLALALLARMLLNPRIYHFGYYQAAIAGLLVPAVLIGEFPERLRLGRIGRAVFIAGVLGLFMPGLFILTAKSHSLLKLKTVPIGKGADRFFIFPANISSADERVRLAVEAVGKIPADETVLVISECVMINYLSRHRGSEANVGDGPDDEAVAELRRHPPDWVVLISRDLRDVGIQRYGEKPGSGKLVIDWVKENYTPAWKTGGDPLDSRQSGLAILRRR